MLQALLAERFKVTLHHDTKDLTVYALTVAKGGLKMTPGDPNGKSALQGGGTSITAKDTSIGDIIDVISRGSRGMPSEIPPVVDMTGVTGRFNFTVDAGRFLQSFSEYGQKGALDISALISSVQELLESQLGLRSELRKARTEITVVDRADQIPSSD